MKITLSLTPKKVAVYALLAAYGLATVAVGVLLFDPEQLIERTSPTFLVAPFMIGPAVTAWLFFLRPLSARIDGTVLSVREPRRLSRVDLATVADVSFDQSGPALVLPRKEVEGETVRLPLDAAKEPERAAIAAALDGNEHASAREAAARVRMLSVV